MLVYHSYTNANIGHGWIGKQLNILPTTKDSNIFVYILVGEEKNDKIIITVLF